MVVIDALTQQLPRWRQTDEGDPLLPTLVPEPFAEIVRNSVRRDPQQRWSVADISSRLRGSSHTTRVMPAPRGGSQEIRTPHPAGFEGHASRPGTQLNGGTLCRRLSQLVSFCWHRKSQSGYRIGTTVTPWSKRGRRSCIPRTDKPKGQFPAATTGCELAGDLSQLTIWRIAQEALGEGKKAALELTVM